MRLALLSDIHANLTALDAVLNDMESREIGAVVLLGDLINYGPRPNEVVDRLRHLGWPILCNIWGNHEYSLFGGSPERFATDRGRAVLEYTKGILSSDTWEYLRQMNPEGREDLSIGAVSIMTLHGTPDDPYWGKFSLNNVEDIIFKQYDYVLTGHSHIPHYFEHFYPSDDPAYRNKKRTIFINPGSIGQPRDHNPNAQYGILDLDTGSYEHCCVKYDVAEEQRLFSEAVDVFYKYRLEKGI